MENNFRNMVITVIIDCLGRQPSNSSACTRVADLNSIDSFSYVSLFESLNRIYSYLRTVDQFLVKVVQLCLHRFGVG